MNERLYRKLSPTEEVYVGGNISDMETAWNALITRILK